MSHTLYTASVQRVQRCELAVPGSSPEMFEKAMKVVQTLFFLILKMQSRPTINYVREKISLKLSMIWTGRVTGLPFPSGLMGWTHNIWLGTWLIWLSSVVQNWIRF